MTTVDEAIAQARKRTVTETTYDLPADAPVAAGWNPNERVRPSRVVVKEYDDGAMSVTVTGHHVKKDGTRYLNGAGWHGVNGDTQREYERALGFVRVPKA